MIAKTGLDAQQTQLDVISNNLANVSTTGFKRARAVFEDLLYQTIRQPGAQSSQQTQLPTGLQLGTGVRPVATERMFTQGNLQQTGNALDVAINGHGFFQVLLPDGTTAYTRDGSFQVDAKGQLVTSSGYRAAAGDHHPGQRAGDHHRPRRHGQRDAGRAVGGRRRSARCSSRTSSTRPACRRRGENLYLETGVVGHAERPTRPAATASARCSRATSKPRTSTWSRSWST